MGIVLWIIVIPLLKIYEAHNVIQSRRLTKAPLGGTVTLDCFYPVDFQHEPLNWYRQILGLKPEVMVKKWRDTEAWNPYFKEDSKSGRLTVQKSKDTFNLTIRNIRSSDEATYYCAAAIYNEIKFGNGTFLAVTGHFNRSFNDNTAFFCIWSNCENITAGNITELHKEKTMDPVVFGLISVLGLCFVLISYLVGVIYRYKKHQQANVDSKQKHTNRSFNDPPSGQDAEELMNYAALHFSDKKTKRPKKKGDLPRESIYSDVRH